MVITAKTLIYCPNKRKRASERLVQFILGEVIKMLLSNEDLATVAVADEPVKAIDTLQIELKMTLLSGLMFV